MATEAQTSKVCAFVFIRKVVLFNYHYSYTGSQSGQKPTPSFHDLSKISFLQGITT